MAALPDPQHQTVAAIMRWYEEREASEGGHRAHLGASLIGHACERYLWMVFRWVRREAFSGRMLRLFEAGRQFEPRVVSELRAVGIQVHDADEAGGQFRVSAHGGHFGGSLDGACLGLPEAPKTWHCLEFKTANDEAFAGLLTQGVAKAKPLHFDQMQTYMGLTGMDRALYLAENKNTSALYQERVEFDPVAFARIMARAERIITAAEPPARISTDPAWWQCKLCAMHPVCHGEQVPEVNCRTCAHVTPELDGDARWSCAHHKRDVSTTEQRAGCGSHRFIPILLERLGAQRECTPEADGNATVHYTTADGGTFANGCPPAFASTEIRAAQSAALADPVVQQVKKAWKTAKVVA